MPKDNPLNRLRCVVVLAGAMAFQYSGTVKAALEEVVVTAQKKEENIQQTPLAISALTSEDMQKKGITSIEGLAQATPSIAFAPYPGQSGTLILYMRGQGIADPGQIAADGAVGLYADGFYIARPQSAIFDLADIERVEVLRGPQGTLYGKNTTGGAVNLISKLPTGEFGFKQNLTFGSRNRFRSLTTINLPEVGGVATKFTLLKSAIDGFVKNPGNSPDFGEQSQQAGRFMLHWTPLSPLAIDYFVEKADVDSTPGYFQNPALNGTVFVSGIPYYGKSGALQGSAYRPVDMQVSRATSEGHGLTVTWDVNDQLSLKSLTGYRKMNFHSYVDYIESINLPYTSESLYHQHQFSQEIQLLGDALDSRLNYVAGLYFFEESGSRFITMRYPSYGLKTVRLVNADSNSKALYGQLAWTPDVLGDRLQLTLGGRYTRDKKSAERYQSGSVPENGSATGTDNDQSFGRFNPSFTASYQWTDDINLYGRVATGYKAGGSFESGPVGQFSQTYGPEKIISYEAGLKSDWFEKRLRLNAALFISKLDDMQLTFAQANTVAVLQAYNAGKSTIKGLEFSALASPMDNLTLNLDYSYIKAEFNRVDVIAGTQFAGIYPADANIKDLFVLPYSPKHSVALGADYQFFRFERGDLALHLDYRWQSKVYDTTLAGPAVPNRDFVAQKAYGLLNGRVDLAVQLPRGDQVKLGVWGKNLTRRQYLANVIGNGSYAGYSSQAAIWGEPASYGLDIAYEY